MIKSGFSSSFASPFSRGFRILKNYVSRWRKVLSSFRFGFGDGDGDDDGGA